MELAYFPGCSLHGLAREYGVSVGAVCDALGITLKEIPDWSCCGASAAHARSHEAAVDLGARNLAIAEQSGFSSVATACAGCFNRLRTAAHELKKDAGARERTRGLTGFSASGNTDVRHLLGIFAESGMKRRIAANVKKPLAGLRLAAYYGCLLVRPAAVMNFDDPEQPRVMDDLLKMLGAETVQWPHRTECCGGSLAAAEPGIVIELGGEVLESARQAGAEAIVVACPMCQANLDLRQKEIGESRGREYNLPIIYFTQLMGLAFGIAPAKLGFRLLLTSPASILRKAGAA